VPYAPDAVVDTMLRPDLVSGCCEILRAFVIVAAAPQEPVIAVRVVLE
jgi:hypothetical protein